MGLREPSSADHGGDVLYDIGKCEEVGRYMVAKRDLKPGEVIFTDQPAVIGPDSNSLPLCTVCWRYKSTIYFHWTGLDWFLLIISGWSQENLNALTVSGLCVMEDVSKQTPTNQSVPFSRQETLMSISRCLRNQMMFMMQFCLSECYFSKSQIEGRTLMSARTFYLDFFAEFMI